METPREMSEPKPKTTTSGNPPADDCWDGPAPQPIDKTTGQHGDHWILPAEERAKGFVRPVRLTYKHIKRCGRTTTMSKEIAETYARDPSYYGRTFCYHCRDYFPVGKNGEFVWDDGSRVGT